MSSSAKSPESFRFGECQALADVRSMYGRVLSAWAVDLLSLRAAGLDRPSARRAERAASLGAIGLGCARQWSGNALPQWRTSRRAA
ncbi:MAG: hypothetical protein U0638_03810 [Phycisphaerales bacterium]